MCCQVEERGMERGRRRTDLHGRMSREDGKRGEESDPFINHPVRLSTGLDARIAELVEPDLPKTKTRSGDTSQPRRGGPNSLHPSFRLADSGQF